MKHLRSIILQTLLWTLAIVFLFATVGFNIFLNVYIRSTVEAQLDSLTFRDVYTGGGRGHGSGNAYGRAASGEPGTSAETDALPDLTGQQISRVNTTGHVFVIDSHYNVISAESVSEESAQDIAQTLKAEGIDPTELDNYALKTESGRYYLSTLFDGQKRDSCAVFFVDVTMLRDFAFSINIALCGILALTVLLAFLFSRRIALSVGKTVEGLADYAAAIGDGQFRQPVPQFTVYEMQSLAQELHSTEEKLETAQKKQEAFFQNASHELRTPLMSIRCYAEGIDCGVMPVKESAETILAETDRLSEMVERMLYISRLDGEKEPKNTKELDLREVVSLCASQQRALAEKEGLSFVFDFDEQPVGFTAAQRDMEQLFGNLISNALRYAKRTVAVSCHCLPDCVEVLVRDDGEGISEELMPHLFERFAVGKDGKHGIGLSIVRTVAALYGGTVTAENDGGAVFRVALPL